MSTRKPAVGGPVRFKPVCSATGTSYNLENSDVASNNKFKDHKLIMIFEFLFI